MTFNACEEPLGLNLLLTNSNYTIVNDTFSETTSFTSDFLDKTDYIYVNITVEQYNSQAGYKRLLFSVSTNYVMYIYIYIYM